MKINNQNNSNKYLEQKGPQQKKGYYVLRVILTPTLILHWVLTLFAFLGSAIFTILFTTFSIKENSIEFKVISGILFAIGSILMIGCIRYYARKLCLKVKVPKKWGKRWIPLLAWPVLTLLIFATCMVVSNGFWSHNCWQFYYTIYIFVFPLVLVSVLAGWSPWVLFLINLFCYGTYIAFFAFYQQKLTELRPVPASIRLFSIVVLFICTLMIGYGFYERNLNLVSPREGRVLDYGGHGFRYENGWSSVDLSPYYPWNETNLLARLDAPSTLTMEPKDNRNGENNTHTVQYPILDGSEAIYPLYAAFAQAVYPKPVWKEAIVFHSTIEGFRLLTKRQVDIVFNAAPSPSQREDAKLQGAELTYTPIGLEAFVFFVNKDNPITGLTSQQIRDIYSGKIRNWKQLGAPSGRILAFQRPANSGSQTTMERFMGATPLVIPLKEEMVRSMGSIVERVARYQDVPNSIGYSFRYYSSKMLKNDSIKFLAVDGIYPTPENIASRRYPITGELLAITSQYSHPNSKKLIDWILGPQGQELVEKTGYIPISKSFESSSSQVNEANPAKDQK